MATWSASSKITSSDGSLVVTPGVNGGTDLTRGAGPVGGVTSILAPFGSGIAADQPNGVVTLSNDGVKSLTASAPNVTLSTAKGDVIIGVTGVLNASGDATVLAQNGNAYVLAQNPGNDASIASQDGNTFVSGQSVTVNSVTYDVTINSAAGAVTLTSTAPVVGDDSTPGIAFTSERPLRFTSVPSTSVDMASSNVVFTVGVHDNPNYGFEVNSHGAIALTENEGPILLTCPKQYGVRLIDTDQPFNHFGSLQLVGKNNPSYPTAADLIWNGSDGIQTLLTGPCGLYTWVNGSLQREYTAVIPNLTANGIVQAVVQNDQTDTPGDAWLISAQPGFVAPDQYHINFNLAAHPGVGLLQIAWKVLQY